MNAIIKPDSFSLLYRNRAEIETVFVNKIEFPNNSEPSKQCLYLFEIYGSLKFPI